MRKQCDTCHTITDVRPRVRRCHRINVGHFGRRVYCWGRLVTLPAPLKRKRTLESELATAHDGLTNAISRVKRATTSVTHWQNRIKSIERRIRQRNDGASAAPVRAIAVE